VESVHSPESEPGFLFNLCSIIDCIKRMICFVYVTHALAVARALGARSLFRGSARLLPRTPAAA
jgi:hypothetical protein